MGVLIKSIVIASFIGFAAASVVPYGFVRKAFGAPVCGSDGREGIGPIVQERQCESAKSLCGNMGPMVYAEPLLPLGCYCSHVEGNFFATFNSVGVLHGVNDAGPLCMATQRYIKGDLRSTEMPFKVGCKSISTKSECKEAAKSTNTPFYDQALDSNSETYFPTGCFYDEDAKDYNWNSGTRRRAQRRRRSSRRRRRAHSARRIWEVSYASGAKVQMCDSCESACPVGQQLRGGASLIPRVDMPTRCASCCTEMAKCSSFNCPAGWEKKPGANSMFGATRSTCCNEIAWCKSFGCPSGYKLKSGAAAIKGATENVCCDAVCSSHTCPDGYTLKGGAASIAGDTREACCENVKDDTSAVIGEQTASPFCSSYRCPDGYRTRSGAASLKGDTREACCDKVKDDASVAIGEKTASAFCSSYRCPDGYWTKSDAASIEGSSRSACCDSLDVIGKLFTKRGKCSDGVWQTELLVSAGQDPTCTKLSSPSSNERLSQRFSCTSSGVQWAVYKDAACAGSRLQARVLLTAADYENLKAGVCVEYVAEGEQYNSKLTLNAPSSTLPACSERDEFISSTPSTFALTCFALVAALQIASF